MNKQELIEKYEYLNHDCFRRVDTSEVLGDLKQLDKPEVVKVPQFVADWIKYCKNTNVSIARALLVGEVDFYNYANQKDLSRLTDFFSDGKNQEIFARAWLDGYEVEKEPKYFVKLKGVVCPYLNHDTINELWFYNQKIEGTYTKTQHTRKELEEAGFGDVFNSPLFEVEEVEV